MPWYAGYLGGNATDALQCSTGGDNAWAAMHKVYHDGLNDYWAANNTPWSLMYLKRDDLPVQFELAEGYTVGDMYQVRDPHPPLPGDRSLIIEENLTNLQQSVLAVTWPNRVYWQSGSIGVPGGPAQSSDGGPLLSNDNTPGTSDKRNAHEQPDLTHLVCRVCTDRPGLELHPPSVGNFCGSTSKRWCELADLPQRHLVCPRKSRSLGQLPKHLGGRPIV